MEKRTQLGIKLPPDTVKRIDAVRATFPAITNRTACIERAIEDWLAKWEAPEKKRRGK
jgi:hypothetical protein